MLRRQTLRGPRLALSALLLTGQTLRGPQLYGRRLTGRGAKASNVMRPAAVWPSAYGVVVLTRQTLRGPRLYGRRLTTTFAILANQTIS